MGKANACANRLFGFLFGTVVAGSGVYTYLLQEYKASNDLLTEDIYVRDTSKTPPSAFKQTAVC